MPPRTTLALLITVLAGGKLRAEAVTPLTLTVPLSGVQRDSEEFLAMAREKNEGYGIDLTEGHHGRAFEAVPSPDLPPGRYRLHVLAGRMPSGNVIVDPVEVRLICGSQSRQFSPETFPNTGALASLWLDVDHPQGGPFPVAMEWLVGDSGLDLQQYLNPQVARQKFLAQRMAAIQNAKSAAPEKSLAEQLEAREETPDELKIADLDLEERSTTRRDKAVSLTSPKLPRYRLMVAGIHLEKLCPVGIQKVQTDKTAYPAGEEGRLTVTLRNCSSDPSEINLSAAISGQEGLATPTPQSLHCPAIQVPAGAFLDYPLPETFSTLGLRRLGRAMVSVRLKDTRPATAEALVLIEPPRKELVERPKRAFAHYMGCWPAGCGPLYWQRTESEPKTLLHEKNVYGGHVRNFDLLPPGPAWTPEESADLEIRRAMRIGLDGFAVDAWAGNQDARKTLDVLFQVAEQKNYPFEVTICVDPACGGDIVESVKYLLEKHGDSPKLARRDGKPLIFGYLSIGPGIQYLNRVLPGRAGELHPKPEGWHLIGQAFQEAEERVGRPIYYHLCMSWFFLNVNSASMPADPLTGAASILAKYVGAVGAFQWLGPESPAMARQVIANGAEWSGATGMYQKENFPFECYMPLGTEWLQGSWQAARDQRATLLQLITWNDYGENTNIAPAYNSRYTLYDLTSYHIQWWKTGKTPEIEQDRIYLIYAKHPRGAKVFPFRPKWNSERKLEVLTLLTRPGILRLVGRDIEYEAPAGLHQRQFPLAPGPVIAELLRGGKVERRLESPEPITDLPFREDNAMTCISTEFDRHWKADFPDAPPWHYSEYGDLDQDGLPNWFEMYWFSRERGFKPILKEAEELEEKEVHCTKWLDFSTAGYADPSSDVDGDGKTNLEEYLEQTDPTTGSPQSILDTE